jgi:hypothetical protein
MAEPALKWHSMCVIMIEPEGRAEPVFKVIFCDIIEPKGRAESTSEGIFYVIIEPKGNGQN